MTSDKLFCRFGLHTHFCSLFGHTVPLQIWPTYSNTQWAPRPKCQLVIPPADTPSQQVIIMCAQLWATHAGNTSTFYYHHSCFPPDLACMHVSNISVVAMITLYLCTSDLHTATHSGHHFHCPNVISPADTLSLLVTIMCTLPHMLVTFLLSLSPLLYLHRFDLYTSWFYVFHLHHHCWISTDLTSTHTGNMSSVSIITAVLVQIWPPHNHTLTSQLLRTSVTLAGDVTHIIFQRCSHKHSCTIKQRRFSSVNSLVLLCTVSPALYTVVMCALLHADSTASHTIITSSHHDPRCENTATLLQTELSLPLLL